MAKQEAPYLEALEAEENQETTPCGKYAPKQKRLLRFPCSFLATDARPLNLAQGKGFKAFVRALDPRFRIPTRQELEVTLFAMHGEMKTTMMAKLEEVSAWGWGR